GIEGDVTVEPGVYDAAHGEVFPLVAVDVTIHGDYMKYKHLFDSHGLTPLTKIVGDVQFVSHPAGAGALVAIAVDGKVTTDGTFVTGTTLSNSGGECVRGNVTLFSSTVSHCATGVHADHGTSLLLGDTLTASAVNLEVDATAAVHMNWATFGGAGDPA